MCRSLNVAFGTLDVALDTLALQGVIERKRGSGIYVSASIHQKTIGVVFGGDIFSPGFSPFWSLLLQAVRQQVSERKMRLRAYFDILEEHEGLGGHTQLVEDLEARRLEGLLLLSPHFEYDEAKQLRSTGVPLVVFSDSDTGWAVTHDHDQFIRLAALELATVGVRRMGLLGPPNYRSTLENEFCQTGYGDIRVEDWSYETWAWIIPGAGTYENCAYRLTQRMIADAASTPLPNALISMEDTSTRGVVMALREAGLYPGRDIRIITSANKGSPVLEPYAADLTRIEFDTADSVRTALDMLKTLMDGGTPPHNPVLIGPKVVATVTHP